MEDIGLYLYGILMDMGIKEPEEVWQACVSTIITLSKLNEDTEEDFKEELANMRRAFKKFELQ